MLLPQPCLAVEGSERGDAFYRAVGPAAGFTTVGARGCLDVLAVTDLDAWTTWPRHLQLQHVPGLERVGNFFARLARARCAGRRSNT